MDLVGFARTWAPQETVQTSNLRRRRWSLSRRRSHINSPLRFFILPSPSESGWLELRTLADGKQHSSCFCLFCGLCRRMALLYGVITRNSGKLKSPIRLLAPFRIQDACWKTVVPGWLGNEAAGTQFLAHRLRHYLLLPFSSSA